MTIPPRVDDSAHARGRPAWPPAARGSLRPRGSPSWAPGCIGLRRNAGKEGSVIVSAGSKHQPLGHGYDALNDLYGDIDRQGHRRRGQGVPLGAPERGFKIAAGGHDRDARHPPARKKAVPARPPVTTTTTSIGGFGEPGPLQEPKSTSSRPGRAPRTVHVRLGRAGLVDVALDTPERHPAGL